MEGIDKLILLFKIVCLIIFCLKWVKRLVVAQKSFKRTLEERLFQSMLSEKYINQYSGTQILSSPTIIAHNSTASFIAEPIPSSTS